MPNDLCLIGKCPICSREENLGFNNNIGVIDIADTSDFDLLFVPQRQILWSYPKEQIHVHRSIESNTRIKSCN